MLTAKKFRNLVEPIPAERRQRIEEHVRQLMTERPLQDRASSKQWGANCQSRRSSPTAK